MQLVTAAQMQAMDRTTIRDFGLPGRVLMENAGRGAVQAMLMAWGEPTARRIGVGRRPGQQRRRRVCHRPLPGPTRPFRHRLFAGRPGSGRRGCGGQSGPARPAGRPGDRSARCAGLRSSRGGSAPDPDLDRRHLRYRTQRRGARRPGPHDRPDQPTGQTGSGRGHRLGAGRRYGADPGPRDPRRPDRHLRPCQDRALGPPRGGADRPPLCGGHRNPAPDRCHHRRAPVPDRPRPGRSRSSAAGPRRPQGDHRPPARGGRIHRQKPAPPP